MWNQSLAILIAWNRRSPSEIPEPQPVIVTKYKNAHYTLPYCQKEVVATDAVQSEYDLISDRVRNASILHVDETEVIARKEVRDTGIHHADRDFCRDPEERDTSVLMEVLTRGFKGIIVCDGWKPYSKFANRIPCCWAYLLRKSKDIAEKIAEAVSSPSTHKTIR
ncbi:MAG: hypothetical protein EF813_07880 [Methanosarcinales archaeon]|nr:MAG: hypothetical protein EF813_07880 [Methanosarcinales archaeon]